VTEILDPLWRRRGLERAAFGFFLLGAGAVPAIAIANIAFALSGAATIGWRLAARRRGEDFLGPFRTSSPLKAPIGAFVVLTIASAIFSTLPSRSLPQVKGLGTFLLVVFTVALLRDREDVALLLSVWRITTAYLVVRGLLEYAAGADNLGARIAGGLSVYMTYAELLTSFALLFAALALAKGRTMRGRVLDGLIATAAATAVALSLTRNAYLGLIVGLALLLALARPRLLVAAPVVLAVLAVVVPAAVRARALSFFDLGDATMRDRLLMWRAGASMAADRPLFGLGPKRVKDLYPVYRRPGFVLPNPGHLHSNPVTIAAETGIPSLLAYLAFVAAFFVHAARGLRRMADEGDRAVTRGAMAVMAALFVSGLFEYSFGDVEVLMATLVIASLPFTLRREEARAAVPAALAGAPVESAHGLP
jgi:O-antigen ligase